jgi:DNA-binding LytR/AlgR family response regulator
MRIAVCDDDKVNCQDTKLMCLDYLESRALSCEIIEFNSGEEVLIYKQDIDILILDIEMIGIDGITVKDIFADNKKDTMIIFLTSHNELMSEAFGRNVYNFLTKPVQKDKFYAAMDRAIVDLKDDFIVDIVLNQNIHFIRGKNIFYIKSEDKYTNVATQDNKFLIRRSMNEWLSILDNKDFIRVHKSYIVNLAYIKRLGEGIVMDDGLEIRVSKRNYKVFKEAYYNYIKRKAK